MTFSRLPMKVGVAETKFSSRYRNTIQEGGKARRTVAQRGAQAMKEWATGRGALYYPTFFTQRDPTAQAEKARRLNFSSR